MDPIANPADVRRYRNSIVTTMPVPKSSPNAWPTVAVYALSRYDPTFSRWGYLFHEPQAWYDGLPQLTPEDRAAHVASCKIEE